MLDRHGDLEILGELGTHGEAPDAPGACMARICHREASLEAECVPWPRDWQVSGMAGRLQMQSGGKDKDL